MGDTARRAARRLRFSGISPAMAVALLALFVAMGGSAVAASHYLINSTSQVNPKVLKKLKGTDGAEGAKGLMGGTGSAGPRGEAGPEGKPGATGPKGEAGPKGEPGSKGDKGPKGEGGGTSPGLDDSVVGPIALKAEAKEQTVAMMSSVPTGSYILNAKVTVENTDKVEAHVRCYLRAEEKNIDEAQTYLGAGEVEEAGFIETLPLTASQAFASTGTVTLACDDSGHPVAVSNAEISAVQVQPLTHTTT